MKPRARNASDDGSGTPEVKLSSEYSSLGEAPADINQGEWIARNDTKKSGAGAGTENRRADSIVDPIESGRGASAVEIRSQGSKDRCRENVIDAGVGELVTVQDSAGNTIAPRPWSSGLSPCKLDWLNQSSSSGLFMYRNQLTL